MGSVVNSNQETLRAYEARVQEYVDGTPGEVNAHVKAWLDEALGHVPQGGTVLELGSAFGRDADYVEAAGYRVRRTDATEAFVELQRAKGHAAEVLNAITDELGGPYDMVLANAVLLHFTTEEFQTAITKIYKCLQPGGVFALTLKQGQGDEWSNEKLGVPRYFRYWSKGELKQQLQANKFQILTLASAADHKWWMVIAGK